MDHHNLKNKIAIIIVLYREDYNLIYKTLDKIRDFKKIIIDNSNNVELKMKLKQILKLKNIY